MWYERSIPLFCFGYVLTSFSLENLVKGLLLRSSRTLKKLTLKRNLIGIMLSALPDDTSCYLYVCVTHVCINVHRVCNCVTDNHCSQSLRMFSNLLFVCSGLNQ